MQMDIRPIRNESDYDWALMEIAHYFEREPAPGTADAARFDVLASLIEAYEAKHWAIEAPDAVEAIQSVMAQLSLKQADLARLIGSKSRASEIMNRKRGLTMEQAYRLFREWHIPAAVLLKPYHINA